MNTLGTIVVKMDMTSRISSFFPRIGLCALLVIGLGFGSGCASPARRIKKNPDIYAKFDPAIQQMIQQGKIDIGFDKDAVYLALGEPGRVTRRVAKDGEQEIWSYIDVQPRYHHVYGRCGYGCPRHAHHHGSTYVESYQKRERMRVVFEEGAVTSIEALTQDRTY